jgi:CubicO group peptidase (beta-lactamase class C family)
MAYRIGLAVLALVAAAGQARAEAGLDALLATWDQDLHGDLKGVIVLRDGKTVAERYYGGATADTLHDVRSAGKSITSLLVGIAIDRGRIERVDDAVGRYWPAAKGSAIGDVAIADVLTMRSGLAADDEDPASPGQEDKLDDAADPQAFILGVPRAAPPGTRYRYNSVTASVAGIVVAKASGQAMADFASAHLFAPLGITSWKWASDAGGFTKGQGNLSLRLRDFAAIAEIVRAGGIYHGRRVVSRGWIDRSLASIVPIGEGDPYADFYGYFWYAKIQSIAGKPVRVSFASGNGGNKIYIVPARHMVIAIQSSAYGRGYGQKRSEDILKAILAR